LKLNFQHVIRDCFDVNERKIAATASRLAKRRENERLMRHCANLQLALTVRSDAERERGPLSDEIVTIQSFVEKLKNSAPLNILNFLKKFNMEGPAP
jgi:hypothetical protein